MSLYREKNEMTALNPERKFMLRHIRFDKHIVSAQGHYLYDNEGHQYLDALSQYGALPFGHNPQKIWDRLETARRGNEPSFVQPLMNSGAEELAKTLLSIVPTNMRYVTFVNSGAEANEAAIKLSRARTGRQMILSVEGGFHGKTLGALSCTGNPKYREPFLPDTTQFEILPFGDLDRLADRLRKKDVAALMIESIQGEGGMRIQPNGYLAAASALCKEFGTLLVLDEVQSGLGRSGRMFGFQREVGLEPDIILLAKALGGGLVPLGAMLCTASAWTAAFGAYHSSTFANSHLSCVIGSAVVDELLANDCAIVRNASEVGAYFRAKLDEIANRYPQSYLCATGEGLMQGLVLQPWTSRSSYFTAHASHLGYSVPLIAGYLLNEHKVVTAPVFNQSRTLRLQPALTIGKSEIDRITDALDDVGRALEKNDYVKLFGYIVGRSRGKTTPRSGPVVDFPLSTAPNNATGKKRGSFAFLIHPTDEATLFDTLPAEFSNLDDSERADWSEWMRSWFSKMYEPAPVVHAKQIVSKDGGYAEGWLIACPLTPSQMMRLGKEPRRILMHQYLEAARNLNVDIVGLGAFTSIISDGGRDIMGDGMLLSTGSSLTALASVDSVYEVARREGIDLKEHAVAVVGAAGAVGRLAAIHFSMQAGQVVLIGNAQNNKALDALKEVAGEIYLRAIDRLAKGEQNGIAGSLAKADISILRTLGDQCNRQPEGYRSLFTQIDELLHSLAADAPLKVTVDVNAGLSGAKAIVSATSVGKSFIDHSVFQSGAIVCDSARPLDVLASVRSHRTDVLVYEGGVMQLPGPISFGRQNVLGYPRGLNLACLSETITLALEGPVKHYSLGNRIDYDEAVWISEAAARHGFTPYVPESFCTLLGRSVAEIAPATFIDPFGASQNDAVEAGLA
jgi:acetylornithine/succinyldiaminopimelate/putrescine aminotransferase/predicted amino acid dehydrogenase